MNIQNKRAATVDRRGAILGAVGLAIVAATAALLKTLPGRTTAPRMEAGSAAPTLPGNQADDSAERTGPLGRTNPRPVNPFQPLPPLDPDPLILRVAGPLPAASPSSPNLLRSSSPIAPLILPKPTGETQVAGSLAIRDTPLAEQPLRLLGTVRGIRRRALFRVGEKPMDAGPGQSVDGWTIARIGDVDVELVRGNRREILTLGPGTDAIGRDPSTGNQVPPKETARNPGAVGTRHP